MNKILNHSDIHLRILTMHTNKPFKGDGSDLRRAITSQFRDIPVLHNHSGINFNYRSPRVRYIVLDAVPKLMSFNDGLEVVEEIYKVKPALQVGRAVYAVTGTELEDRVEEIGISDTTHRQYTSLTPWLALNENNYPVFIKMGSAQDRSLLLARILVGNLLSLSKNLNMELKETISLRVNHFREIHLKAGQIPMLALMVTFETNYELPFPVGIGKLVSKGFGIMRKLYVKRELVHHESSTA